MVHRQETTVGSMSCATRHARWNRYRFAAQFRAALNLTPVLKPSRFSMEVILDIDLISWAFGFFNLLRLASYIPQIAAVVRDRNGATAISFSCWLIWVGANASTGVYAWIRLHDTNLALISGFNALCCAIILVLAIYKRISHCVSLTRTANARTETDLAQTPGDEVLNPALR